MIPEHQKDPHLPPHLVELSERMSEPPASVKKGLLITAFFPGMGEVYQGNLNKGIRILVATFVFCVLSILTSSIFFPDGPMFVHILHAVFMIAVIWMWVHGMIRTVQLYEAQIHLWRLKKGIPDVKERFDRKEYLDRIRKRGGKHNVEDNLDEILNNPKHSIVQMSLVVSLTFIVTKVNGFLDKVWIANIGNDAVAAIATVSPIYSVVSAVGVGIGTGACVCISYVLGKREYEKTQDLATASVFLSVALAVPLGIFLILSVDPIVGVQGAEITELAKEYVYPLALGCPAIILAGVLGSLFKSEGAVRKMTFCAMISIPINMVFTPLFIYVFGWGIAGASIANVLGSIVSLLVALYMFRKGEYHFKIRFGIPKSGALKEIFSIGGPKATEEMLGGLIILAQNMIIVMKTGSATMALVELAFTFPYLMTLIPDSVTSGAQPVCSAHAGKRDVKGMWDSMKFSLALNLEFSVVSMVVLLLFAMPICSLFSGGDQSAVTDDLLNITRLYAFIIPFYLLGRMSGNMLQVVRKSEVSAVVFTGLGVTRLVLFSLWGNNTMEVVWIEIFMNVMTGAIMFGLLYVYAKRFDPDAVNEKSERRADIFSILRNHKRSTNRNRDPRVDVPLFETDT